MALGDIVQTASGSGATPNMTAAFGSNITVGNMIVLGIYSVNNETDTITSVTDTRGNTYVRAGTLSPSQSLTERCYIYYAYNSSAGACTVTANISANNGLLRCLEVESDMTTEPLDKTINGSANGANPSITLVSALANTFIFGVFAGVNSVTFGTGYTSDFAGNSWNWELVEHDPDSGAAGNVPVTAVMASGNWTGAAASFLLTPPAGADPPPFGVHAPYPGMYPFPRRR